MQYYQRHLEDRLRRHTSAFKTVLLAGARQVGKSTLLRHVFPGVREVVFDPVQDLYGAREDPDQFLETFGSPLILDEIQYAPELLAAIKRKVDQSDAKGQYLLTGSQNLSVLRNVSESLAGRIGILRLDGMTPAEQFGQAGVASWLSRYLDNPEAFMKEAAGVEVLAPEKSLCEYLWRGELPGLLPFANEDIPSYWNSYVQTYVERDIRMMGELSDLAQFGRFLRLCGALTGQEIVQSQLGRELGIHPQTARNWLNLLTWSYQWIEIPAYSGNAIKRISSKPKGHLQDAGLACMLNAIPSPESLLSHPSFGNIFESWGVGWIHRQIQRLPLAPGLYHWRTQNGAEVDLVLEAGGRLFPIEFKASTRLSKHDTRGIQAFRNTYPAAVPGVILYGGSVPYPLSEHAVALPWRSI
ncbi:MAG: ATP-binding protein [Kiritimatiellia bacterium]